MENIVVGNLMNQEIISYLRLGIHNRKIVYNEKEYDVYYDNRNDSAYVIIPCSICGQPKLSPMRKNKPVNIAHLECSNHSIERGLKISESKTGNTIMTDKWRDKISESKLGKHIKTYVKSPEHLQKISETLKNKHFHLSEETKLKMKETYQKFVNSPEYIDYVNDLSFKVKQIWDNMSEEDKLERILKTRLKVLPTLPETILDGLLNYTCPGEYQYCGNNSTMINGICPDFINVNGQKKVIEVFGDYWHSEKITGRTIENEEKFRYDKFKEYGFDCLIIWEHELKNDPETLNKAITRIKEFNIVSEHKI